MRQKNAFHAADTWSPKLLVPPEREHFELCCFWGSVTAHDQRFSPSPDRLLSVCDHTFPMIHPFR